MGRSPCCSKAGLNRGAWTAMEDKILTDYIKIHGEGKWRNVPNKAGLKRCGKSCRLRWLNYLRPDIKRGNITHDEEELIVRLHKLLGNRWSLIAGRLPGRTDNEIKNYWNTNIGKKLQAQKGSTSNPTLSNQSEESKPTNGPPTNLQPPSATVEPCVIWTKATRCTKVMVPSAEAHKNDQLQLETKPILPEPSSNNMVQNLVDGKANGHEARASSISEEKSPSDFMGDLEMDEQFLSEFLNLDFSQLCGFVNGSQGDKNTSTSHGGSLQSSPNSDQAFLFPEERLHDSDLQSMASFLDSEMDW